MSLTQSKLMKQGCYRSALILMGDILQSLYQDKLGWVSFVSAEASGGVVVLVRALLLYSLAFNH